MGLSADLARRYEAFSLELSVAVASGETLVLVGESGAGKSTLLRLIAGIERADSGHIVMDDLTCLDRARAVDVPAWQRPVGYVSQDYALFPHLSVYDNIAFGLRADGRRKQEIADRAGAALARFDLERFSTRHPGELSGGQQQRVALARALVLEPRVLLLDEPLSALDLRTRQSVRGELKRLLAGLTCATLFVTHHPVEALVFGDRVAALEAGRLTQVGTRDELLRRPRSAYVAAFLGINLFRGSIAGRSNGIARLRTEHGEISVVDPGGDGDLFAVVSPRDISLVREAPGGSAQNVFRGRIAELIPEPPNGERVRVVLETAPSLVAEITDQAKEGLGLKEGLEVHASFKATGIDVFR